MNSNNWRIKREPADTPTEDKMRSPGRPYQKRPSIDQSSSGGSHNPRYTTGNSASLTRARDELRQPVDDGKASRSIEEGRRVYVGNLPYEATVKDLETLFKDMLNDIESINISIDPMTGRNPSYCFIDFTSPVLAKRVIAEYNGRVFMRRPLKVKPGVKSGTGKGRFDLPARNTSTTSNNANRWNRLDASGTSAAEQGRRLFVGGLPRFESNEDCAAQIRELFREAGFELEVVSKLVWRDEAARWDKGNRNYCFVDMRTVQDASGAVKALNGCERWGWRITVDLTDGVSGKLNERRRLWVGGLPKVAVGVQEGVEEAVRELFMGFDVRSVSVLEDGREGKNGYGHFCFVEVGDERQADKAIEELDGKEFWGGKVAVRLATRTGIKRQSEGKSLGDGGRWR